MLYFLLDPKTNFKTCLTNDLHCHRGQNILQGTILFGIRAHILKTLPGIAKTRNTVKTRNTFKILITEPITFMGL